MAKNIINIKELTNGEIDALIISGDITEDEYNDIRLKNPDSYIVICNDKMAKFNDAWSIAVLDNDISTIIDVIYKSLIDEVSPKMIIGLDLKDIKITFGNHCCVAFTEKGDNIDTIVKNVRTTLKNIKIKDEALWLHINGTDSLTIMNVNDIV